MRGILGALLVALAAACGATHAATIGDRSPIHPGLWWDADHDGSGFELHVGGDQVFAIWYTYAPGGAPIWYTAQGAMDAAGLLDAALLQHRWADGRYAGASSVGTLRLQRQTLERVTATWNLNGSAGAWTLTPYPLGGVPGEVDHTGAWFDGANPGYGMTLYELGGRRTAAYYVYDAAGAPTWLFGSGSVASGELTLYATTGACPSCSGPALQSRAAARLQLALYAETALGFSVTDLVGQLAPAWRLTRQPLHMLTRPASQRLADRQPVSFDGAARLEQYVESALLYPGYNAQGGMIDFSPPPPQVAFSGTNLIESGVDEPDVVKSDGRYVHTFAGGAGVARSNIVRSVMIDGAGPALQQRAAFQLAAPGSTEQTALTLLYLTGDDLVAITGTRSFGYDFGFWASGGSQAWMGGTVHLEIVDRRDRDNLVSRWRASIDGHYLASRRIGSQLYLVTRFAPRVDGLSFGATAAAQVAANQAVLAQLPLTALLPAIRIGAGAPQPLLTPERVLLPPTINRSLAPELVCVTRIDLGAPDQFETLAILGGADNVYVAPENLYLATNRYQPYFDPIAGPLWGGTATADIHRFAIAGGTLALADSGSIEGSIDGDVERAPFRFSEHDGKLRVVSIGEFGALGKNLLSVLEPSTVTPGLLRVVAQLPNAARPEPLGKPHEKLYGTRFVGARLYAVTFNKVDPLYVVDLANPADPFIAGQVELPGFSDYLHPLADGLLLGAGLDAVPNASWGDGQFSWFQGVKLALFDVRDPAAPRVLDEVVLGKRGSTSALLGNHLAFSILPIGGTQRFAIPVRLHEPNGSEPPNPPANYYYPYASSGLYAFDVTGTAAAASLTALPPLITDRAPAAGSGADDAGQQARSVLLGSGAIYVEKGRWWYAGWDATATPVGPL